VPSVPLPQRGGSVHDGTLMMRAVHCPATLQRTDSRSRPLNPNCHISAFLSMAPSHGANRSLSSAYASTAPRLLCRASAQLLSADFILSTLNVGSSLLAHAASASTVSACASRWLCHWRHQGVAAHLHAAWSDTSVPEQRLATAVRCGQRRWQSLICR
jgi:hypothetical protein